MWFIWQINLLLLLLLLNSWILKLQTKSHRFCRQSVSWIVFRPFLLHCSHFCHESCAMHSSIWKRVVSCWVFYLYALVIICFHIFIAYDLFRSTADDTRVYLLRSGERWATWRVLHRSHSLAVCVTEYNSLIYMCSNKCFSNNKTKTPVDL